LPSLRRNSGAFLLKLTKMKYRIAITGTNEQIREISNILMEKGIELSQDIDNQDGFLLTKWGENYNIFATCIRDCNFINVKEIFSYEEKELFIALALMQGDDGFHVGESVILTDDNGLKSKGATVGNLYTLGGYYYSLPDNDQKFYIEQNNYGNADGHFAFKFRKATYEEICAHYRKGIKYGNVSHSYAFNHEKINEQMKKIKEFVLPEKWSIERTKENSEVINEWFNKNTSKGYSYTAEAGFVSYPEGNSFNISFIPIGHTEITFEQFGQYVLKTKNMELTDNFAVIVENNNSEKIIDFLKDKGYTDEYVNGGGRNGGHYYISKGETKIRYSNILTEPISKKYTLNELKQTDKNMEKKIIGYKLIKPEYTKALEGLLDCVWSKNEDLLRYKPNIDKLREAKVLDIWFEPVYAEKSEMMELAYDGGTVWLKIEKDKISVDSWSAVFDKKELENIKSKVVAIPPIATKQVLGDSWYINYEIDKISIGCKKGFLIKNVITAIDKALNF
jgi:hypothetical protein